MGYRLHRKQVLGGDLSEVFAFFKEPENLGSITPSWIGFQMESSSDATVREGTVIRYKIKLHGLPMKWKSKITDFTENKSFADEMLAGPYSSWFHHHLFREVPGGVEVEDIVDYKLPLGPLGALAHTLWVRRQLQGIFDFRESQMERLFPRVGSATATQEAE